MIARLSILGLLLWCGACARAIPAAPEETAPAEDAHLDGSDDDNDNSGVDDGDNQPVLGDPYAPFSATPPDDAGLVNVSADLEALLEHGALEGACDEWQRDPDDLRKKLLCGKSMFFYEGFGAIGVPTALYDFFGNEFPEITGTAWSGYGLVPDPTHTTPPLPLGVAPGAPLGSVQTQAYTCASCHFGKLPDGRYAVGAPNHAYEYGKQLLAIAIPPGSISPSFDASAHHEDAVAAVLPLLDELEANRGLRLRLMFDLLPLLGIDQAALDRETEGHYAHWRSGTLDFMMAPLPLEDNAHTVSKILSLWGLASEEETADAGMPHEQLAWTGGAPTLMDFLDGFVAIGDGTDGQWTHERLSPLHAYLLSLQAPENPQPPPSSSIERGADQFARACLACHDGPRGMGRALYRYEEIGTDDAMKAWADPDLDGESCCGFGPATQRIKSPRLVGLWAQTRFLHNGSVSSLDELLCLTPRRDDPHHAQSSRGHLFGCELSHEARRDLIAFLSSR